jgi:hypothetical protein
MDHIARSHGVFDAGRVAHDEGAAFVQVGGNALEERRPR